MKKQEKPRGCLGTNLFDSNVTIISRAPPKYSAQDWDNSNKQTFQVSEDQQRYAERFIEESNRIVGEARSITKSLKSEVDHHLKERTAEIRFLVDELEKQKRTGMVEEESLKSYKTRIDNCISFLKTKSLAICERCMILREGRIGMDLVEDEVESQLKMEQKVIQGCQGLINKTLNETVEQIRRLKATIYLLDRDLSNKNRSLLIDQSNLSLRENQQQMSIYHGDTPLALCNYTLAQWEEQTHKNIENTAKELNSATQLRSYVDLLLRQVVEDLENQRDRTNDAFIRRCQEVSFTKAGLEATHKDTLNRVNELNRNCTDLQHELADKEGFLALCQMRLGNRAQRQGLELTCDNVQLSLYKELANLKETISTLNQKYHENQATLRYLLRTQVMQERDINIKANTLKIDEVDCMTIRQALHYQSF